MPIDFQYDEDRKVVETSVSGVLTTSEIKNHLANLASSDAIPELRYEFVDLNGVEDFSLLFSELQEIKQITAELPKKGHEATIFCAYAGISRGIVSLLKPLFSSQEFSIYICDTPEALDSLKELISKSE